MPKELKITFSIVIFLFIVAIIAKLYSTNKMKEDFEKRYMDAIMQIDSIEDVNFFLYRK